VPSNPDCQAHHWIIASVAIERDGRRVFPAVCKKCPAEKDHTASLIEDFNGPPAVVGKGTAKPRRVKVLADEYVVAE
jgi:hypothetical protein